MVAEAASQSQVFKSYRGGCGIASRRGIAVPTVTGYRDIGRPLIIDKRCGGRRTQTAGDRTSHRNEVFRRIRGHPEVKKPAGFHPQVFLKDRRTAVQQDSENRTSQQQSGMTVSRIDGATTGQENIFGISPRFEDITWDGLNFTAEQFEMITSIDKDAWKAELELHTELFDKLKYRLPAELEATKTALAQRLA